MFMIAPKLLILYSKMDWIIVVIKMEANIDKENHTITLDDCSIQKFYDFIQLYLKLCKYSFDKH